jgi:type I restriction enzyme R subunit
LSYSHFSFLAKEWPAIHEAGVKAEQHARSDAQTSCFYARRSLELLVDWLYSADASLNRPYRDDLNALIHEPSFRRLASDSLFTKADLVRKLGNKAVHDKRPMGPQDGVSATRELFHLCYWMARTCARKGLPDPKLQFDSSKLPASAAASSPEVVQQTRELIARYRERGEALAESEKRLAAQATRRVVAGRHYPDAGGRAQEGARAGGLCGEDSSHPDLHRLR